MYSETIFVKATVEALTAHGVDPDRAQMCADILNRQNLGLLPCPLEEPELSIIRETWEQTMGAAEEAAA